MNAYRSSGYLLIFLGVMCAGCSKEPNAVGIKLIPGSEKFKAHDTSLVSFNDTTFRVAAVNGFGANVLVGNQASITCTALLRFTTTIPALLDTVHLDTAQLTLTVNYAWNETVPATPAIFELKEVKTPWAEATVTSDSLATLSLLPTSSTPVTVTNQDTLYPGKVLTAQVDPAMVHRWITISADTADTLTPRFFSIAIVPKAGMVNVGIWGFNPFGSATPPTLTLIYTTKDGVKDSVILNSGEDTFFATAPPITYPAVIETQGGIAVRSRVRFDLKPISDSIGKAIINDATLQLTLNSSASLLGLGSEDSLVAFFSGSSSAPDSVQPLTYSYGYRQNITQGSDTTYIFSLTSIVQQWINSPSNNFGVTLRSIKDVSSVDKLVFYPSKDPSRAPKLLITYTKK